MLYYTGVGSRDASKHPGVMLQMACIASTLEELGFHARTGDATGADEAIKMGVKNVANITIFDKNYHVVADKMKWLDAVDMVINVHPSPRNAMPYMSYLGRNAFQVLGENLDTPSKFLVCWTPGGKNVGGTATTIAIARLHGIPVFNIASCDASIVIARARMIVHI